MRQVRRHIVRPDRLWLLLPVLATLVVLALAVSSAADHGGVALAEGTVAHAVRDLLMFAVACGLLSAATLELVKRFSSARGRFQGPIVIDWVARRAEACDVPASVAVDQLRSALDGRPYGNLRSSNRPDEAIWLSVAPRYRRFDLPADLLTARLASAADLALADPDHYDPLARVLVGRPEPLRFDHESMTEAGAQRWRRTRAEAVRDDSFDRMLVADTQRLQSALDGLQIELAARWRRLVQAVAVALAGLYGIAFSQAAHLTGSGSARYLLAGVLLGGPAAWVARDLTAVLERLRGG